MNFVLPLLMLSSSASSSMCFSIRSDSFHSRAWRSAGSIWGHAPDSNAARAAATAALTSAALASATEAISRPIAGSTTEMRSLDFDSTHAPPMNKRGARLRNFATAAEGSGCEAIWGEGAIEAFTLGTSGWMRQSSLPGGQAGSTEKEILFDRQRMEPFANRGRRGY